MSERKPVRAIATFGYMLVLNDMRERAQFQVRVGPFDTRDEALNKYRGELAPEPYDDEDRDYFSERAHPGLKTYRKTFKRGGPFEWLNPLTDDEMTTPGLFGHGIHRIVVKLEDIEE